MTKRILVPLGERERDEAILPLVGALARESGGTVRLLRVYPVPEIVLGSNDRVLAYVDQEMDRLSREGLIQLKGAELQLDGVPVESVVRFGEPVEEILLETEAWSADLIALRTARRSRLWSAISPGVADRVGRQSTTPTLALRR
ncbi:MAG TPA: universal stress protein [Methylomirabilota bacterium]|nr:universal stress protein [Methylomirabilota bacterium]